MIRAVLFDLDGTLVDTSCITTMRAARRWRECVARVGETIVFPAVTETLTQIRRSGRVVGVVTSSVSFYAERLLTHHEIPYDALVAYHDSAQHKPHAEPVQVALRRLSVSPEEALGVGDLSEDADSLWSAGVTPYGAGWSPTTDSRARWAGILGAPTEVLMLLSTETPR